MSVVAAGIPEVIYSGKDGGIEWDNVRQGRPSVLLGQFKAFFMDGVIHVYKPQL